MKIFDQLKNTKILSLSLIVLATVSLSSCDKDDDDATSGKAQIRITNAVEGSASQELYLDGNKISTSAVAYGNTSSYIETNSGDRQAQFRNEGSATASTAFDLELQNNKHYSVYFTGNAESKTSVVTEDDTTAPSSGKAKVRFVHLASAVTSSVDVGLSAANKVFTDVAYKAASAYKEVDANTKFFLYGAGSTQAELDMSTAVQVGKIYTIYLSGSTIATLKYTVVAEN
ncbi:DUF4397 domain-containing protein [Mucilaginibacter sp. JRF]|uniref:DUF4397 domain-containing protein n=1 Tax=Mucilaginibacter sp. JRF TaxID=2780088 RepID=UPI0018808E2F|nr:DUF4397 domain-containing protein [Mucilaginibacter sp. JRF]MBE9584155.1 DUF4397 domain-containing protein [Mucilaginibacter sp. JRF]